MTKTTSTKPRLAPLAIASLAALATVALPCLARDAHAETTRVEPAPVMEAPVVEAPVVDAPRAERAERARPITLVSRAALDASKYGFGLEAALDGMVRVHRALLVGGAIAYSPEAHGFEGCSTAAFCDVKRLRAGGRVEAHAWLDGWIDPWIGAYAGVLHVQRTPFGGAREGVTGLEARAEIGIDLRVAGPSSTLAVGPMLSFGVAGAGEEKRLIGGLRLGLAF